MSVAVTGSGHLSPGAHSVAPVTVLLPRFVLEVDDYRSALSFAGVK